jgi:hypothetical protein
MFDEERRRAGHSLMQHSLWTVSGASLLKRLLTIAEEGSSRRR